MKQARPRASLGVTVWHCQLTEQLSLAEFQLPVPVAESCRLTRSLSPSPDDSEALALAVSRTIRLGRDVGERGAGPRAGPSGTGTGRGGGSGRGPRGPAASATGGSGASSPTEFAARSRLGDRCGWESLSQ